MRKIFFLCSLMALPACSTINEVKSRQGKGGEIGLRDGLFGESAAKKAKVSMKEVCPKGYDIVEKAEEPIYKQSEVTELRIKYQCKGRKTSSGIVSSR